MKFLPEDFYGTSAEPIDARNGFPQAMADIANAKLEAWLKEAPTMYGWNFGRYGYEMVEIPSPGLVNQKYKGKLVCVEEIKK